MPKFYSECPICKSQVVQSPACNKHFRCFLCRETFVCLDSRCDVCEFRINCLTMPPIKAPIYVGR